jgi:hypothetical protein
MQTLLEWENEWQRKALLSVVDRRTLRMAVVLLESLMVLVIQMSV